MYDFNCGTAIKKFCHIVFTLSHGQVSVERGFSVIKDMMVDNLLQESIIAHRTIKDSLYHFYDNDVTKCPVSNDLYKYARMARQLYHQKLAEKKKDNVAEESLAARKEDEDVTMKSLERQKRKLEQALEKVYGEMAKKKKKE